jgi:hypothetical protein
MPQSAAARRRDVGLGRLALATRWIAIATLGLVGAFGALVAHALPGHSSRAVRSTMTEPGASATTSATTAGLQSPAAAPAVVPTGTPAQVVSGGS